MNVIVSTHDPLQPIHGGGALRTLKCAEELHRRGHRVMIVAPTDGTGELSGIKVHWLHAPRKHRSQLLSSLKFNVRLLRKFLQFIRTTDVFFVHNTIAAASLPFLKPFFPFRFVLDVTDVHAEYLRVGRPTLLERLVTPALLQVEYWIIRAADCVIVESRAMRRLLASHGVRDERLAVVYDGSDSAGTPAAKLPGSERTIIHLGSIDKQHGVECLVRAVPLVLERHPDARFLFVGGGRLLPEVSRLAGELGVDRACVFTDFLPFAQAQTALSQAAIGVIPRPDSLPNHIVTTLKIFEYWASGTAVVSSRLDAIAEIAGEGRDVLFFEPGNSTDLARALIRLLEHPEQLATLRAGGLKTAATYQWRTQIPQIIDFAVR